MLRALADVLGANQPTMNLTRLLKPRTQYMEITLRALWAAFALSFSASQNLVGRSHQQLISALILVGSSGLVTGGRTHPLLQASQPASQQASSPASKQASQPASQLPRVTGGADRAIAGEHRSANKNVAAWLAGLLVALLV
jgi:hypothetical protein